jgi:hypothetical protein
MSLQLRDRKPMQRAVTPTTVQTLIFDAKKFSASKAKAWAKAHGFRFSSVDETTDSVRLRQHNPEDFKPGSFRTIELTNGVSAVIGKMKTGAAKARAMAHGHMLGAPIGFGDEALVERPSPGAAPTAFRIWKAGVNMSDDGPDIFTERSAQLIMAEQAQRGNLYSIDFDHLSLRDNRPAEAGRAAGWHRLEVRRDAGGEAELWLTNADWCADAKAGLEETPPRWRYFSPAFDVDPDTHEIVSYVNTALCINPATWNNVQLATRNKTHGAVQMKLSKAENEKLASLRACNAMMHDENVSAEHKAAAETMYKIHGGGEEHKRLEEAEKMDEAETRTAGTREADETRAADAPPDSDADPDSDPVPTSRSPEAKKRTASADPPFVTATRTRAAEAVVVVQKDPVLEQLATLSRKVESMEKADRVRAVRKQLSRTALADKEREDLAHRLVSANLEDAAISTIVNGLPRATVTRTAPAPTRGERQGMPPSPEEASGLDREVMARAKTDVEKALRLSKSGGPVGFAEPVNGRRVFHTRAPSEFRRANAVANKPAVSGGEGTR